MNDLPSLVGTRSVNTLKTITYPRPTSSFHLPIGSISHTSISTFLHRRSQHVIRHNGCFFFFYASIFLVVISVHATFSTVEIRWVVYLTFRLPFVRLAIQRKLCHKRLSLRCTVYITGVTVQCGPLIKGKFALALFADCFPHEGVSLNEMSVQPLLGFGMRLRVCDGFDL